MKEKGLAEFLMEDETLTEKILYGEYAGCMKGAGIKDGQINTAYEKYAAQLRTYNGMRNLAKGGAGMRKTVALLLVLLMCLSVCGCGMHRREKEFQWDALPNETMRRV